MDGHPVSLEGNDDPTTPKFDEMDDELTEFKVARDESTVEAIKSFDATVAKPSPKSHMFDLRQDSEVSIVSKSVSVSESRIEEIMKCKRNIAA